MAEKARGVTVDLGTAKALVDWILRLAPLVLFLVQFYVQADKTVDRTKQDDTRIRELETKLNEIQREVNDEKAEAGALKQHVEDQEKYYLLTGTRPR
jgi:peptidoglycan hydrolase CwlO-like protein